MRLAAINFCLLCSIRNCFFLSSIICCAVICVSFRREKGLLFLIALSEVSFVQIERLSMLRMHSLVLYVQVLHRENCLLVAGYNVLHR